MTVGATESGGDGEWRGDDGLGVAAPLGFRIGVRKDGWRVGSGRVSGYGVTILRRYDGEGVLNAQVFGQFT